MGDTHIKDNLPEKSEWGPGPWQNEPDRIEFEHRGLPCLMQRSHVGSWCGYVAVPPDHPYFERSYTDCGIDPRCQSHATVFHCKHAPESTLKVHGGITYADHCRGNICHKPKEEKDDHVWWFGFDCAHAGDYLPMYAHIGLRAFPWNGTYKDVEFVRKEVIKLADQLAELK